MGNNHTTEQINEAMNAEVAKQRPASSLDDLRKAFPTTDVLRYIANDTFIADPTKLLGRVYYEKVGSDALVPFQTRLAVAVDEGSKLTAPITVSELIVDSKISVSAEFLALVSLSVGTDEIFELRVINNAAARAVDVGDGWDAALEKWYANPRCKELVDDPSVSAVSVVTGVVQKYLTSKKFKKFEAGVKGGYVGVNVAGNLYMSSSEFQLDVVYGVDLVSFGSRSKPSALTDAIASANPMTKRADIDALGDKFVTMAKVRGFAVPRPRSRRAR